MLLTPGLRLGPYEIQSAIGAGGMGEVYRARDTRLDRIVAIKVLSAQLSDDPQFRERFDREARAISALEHAHICSLYDVGDHEGTSFLVMQYLDGETLEARLRHGALPIDQALQCAVQIADALDKAHRSGIVHRDLKPGNVMLTKSGAKLLDFGLAKSAPARGAAAGLSMLPTTPPGLTAQGTILGTFQYMAPEQLEGQEADSRTDIFAFGTVIYEMLTGRKAFAGKSQASLIGAILKDHPPAPSSLQPLAPRALDRVVRVCLAKDPDDRWQSAGDLKRELQWIGEGNAGAAGESAAAPLAKRPRFAWLAAAVLAVVLAVSIAALLLRRDETGTTVATPLVRFNVSTAADLSDRYASNGFALSPDGRTLAYVDGAGPTYTLFVRPIDTLESKALVTSEDIRAPFWSPDNRAVAFFSLGSLKVVTVADSTTQTVCALPNGTLVHGGTWGPGNVILFAIRSGLYRVPATGGAPVRLLDKEATIRWPQLLPGGKRFLYTRVSPREDDAVYLSALDAVPGAPPLRIMATDYMAQYADPGYLVFVRDNVLFAQQFDPENASLRGVPITLAPRVAVSPDVNFKSADFSVGGGGSLAYRTGSNRSRLTWLDRTGSEQGVIGGSDDYSEAELSPDGTQIAAEINDKNGFGEIWVIDAIRGTRVPLTRTSDLWEFSPRWSPDGRFVVYSTPTSIQRKLADRSGAEEILAQVQPLTFVRQWTPDGRSILLRMLSGGLLIAPASPKSDVSPLAASSDAELSARASPDGKWLLYSSVESGRREVYVRPIAGGPRTLISIAGGGSPLWRSSGTELYYQALDGTVMAVAVSAKDHFTASAPRALFKTRTSSDDLRQTYSTIDGQRFLVRTLDASSPPSITWTMNWPALIAAQR